MRFSESIKYDIPKPIKNAISDSSPFKSDESLSDDISLPDDRPNLSPNDFSTQILIFLQILTHLLNQFSKLLVLIIILTEPVTHLKTNLHHLLLQIIEIPNSL